MLGSLIGYLSGKLYMNLKSTEGGGGCTLHNSSTAETIPDLTYVMTRRFSMSLELKESISFH